MPFSRLSSVLLAVLLLVAPSRGQIKVENAPLLEAAGVLDAGGIVTAELKSGAVRYAAFGKPLERAGVPPEKIIFEIGSITKVFTGLLLAQAVVEGKVALSDPIAKYLPADLALPPATAAITLEQLSVQTSGLPRLPDNLNPAVPGDPYADYDEARLYDFLRRYEPAKPAPQPFGYSNLGVGLLGHLLARAYGQTYQQLVTEKICAPLGLVDTTIELSAEQKTRFAVPHSGSVAVLPWQLNALAGAGALRSTAADLMKFAQTLLSTTDHPLKAAWTLAQTPRAAMGGNGEIGLGIMSFMHDGARIYNHGGGTGGFRTILEFTPARPHAFIGLINNDAFDPVKIAASTRTSSPKPTAINTSANGRAEVALDPAKIDDYLGVYTIDARGKFTAVKDASGRLQMRLTGQPFFPAFYAGDDRFFLKIVAAEFQFKRGADGKISGVTLHQNGREIPAQRTALPPPPVVFLESAQLKAYVGKYQLAHNLLFEVTTRGGHLFVKLTGQQALPVHCDRPDHFVYDVVEAALTFERDANGAITQLILHQNGLNQPAKRLP